MQYIPNIPPSVSLALDLAVLYIELHFFNNKEVNPMTADEIQRRIGYLEGQIDALQQENTTLRKNIGDLEEGGADASSLVGKWEKILADCFGVVKSHLSKVDPNSGFNSYYIDRINTILSSKEANEIGECLGSIKADTQRKISEFEDIIKSNNARVYQHQNEIDELRALQVTGAV